MSDPDWMIYKRRIALEKQERVEREACLKPVRDKYEPLFLELYRECARIGHEWRTVGFTIGGDELQKCSQCAGTRRVVDKP